MNPTIEQKPTVEQLNQWSAEILGKDKFIFEHYLPAKSIVLYGHGHDKGVLFSPATDLSQAWKEFIDVLDEYDYQVYLSIGTVQLLNHFYEGKEGNIDISVTGIGLTRAAESKHGSYLLTYAFVQAFADKSPGYLEWKAA